MLNYSRAHFLLLFNSMLLLVLKESSWDHPLIDKYRKLYIDEIEKFALPLPPPPSSSDLISLEEQEKEVDQSNDLNDNYNYIPKENPSLETEVINLKNELLNCQVSMQKNSKYIIQHLRQVKYLSNIDQVE